ncbi:MAG: hypothetical protein R3D62_02465 [Xanthobacteraceae bacterium]
MKNDGAFLIALDPSRPEGYHWVGIASGREKGDEAIKMSVRCYEQSVSRHSSGPNKDNLNLAEHFFVDGDYEKAKKYAEDYLLSVSYRFNSPLDIIGHFFRSTAEYMKDNGNKRLIQAFVNNYKSLSNKAEIRFEGSYDPRDLFNYLQGEKFNSLNKNQKTKICEASKIILAAGENCRRQDGQAANVISSGPAESRYCQACSSYQQDQS